MFKMTDQFDVVRLSAAALLAAALPLSAAGEAASTNRLFIGIRSTMNVSASFRGGFAAPDAGAASGTDISRSYYDGFVGVDSSGNALGVTSYFGYESLAAQENGNSLEYHSSEDNQLDLSGAFGASCGFEAGGIRTLLYGEHFTLGAELIGAFEFIKIRDRGVVSGSATLITDSYPINDPPNSPVLVNESYTGPYDSAGESVPLLDAEPTARTTSATGLEAAGSRKIQAALFSLQFGPRVECRPFSRLTCGLSAGLYLALCDTEFEYHETIRLDAVSATYENRGKDSDTKFLHAGYIRIAGEHEITDSWQAYAAFSYLSSNTVNMQAGGRKASLNLADSFTAALGIGYQF